MPPSILRFALAAVALAFALRAPASAAFILVPPSLADTQGGLGGTTPFAFPTTTGIRTQLAYDASLFGTTAPQLITAIQFRPIDPVSAFSGATLNVSNVRLQLSTTARSDENRNPLSATFADNVGADAATVYSGALSITTSSTLLPNGTRAFDYTITLQTPFLYDPTAGNLLLDTLVPTGASVRGTGLFGAFARFDTTGQANDGIYSVINSTSGSATAGTVNSNGPVTRFVVESVVATPAPASVTLFGAGAGGMALVGRLRRKS